MGGGTHAELTHHGERCDGIWCGLGIPDAVGNMFYSKVCFVPEAANDLSVQLAMM